VEIDDGESKIMEEFAEVEIDDGESKIMEEFAEAEIDEKVSMPVSSFEEVVMKLPPIGAALNNIDLESEQGGSEAKRLIFQFFN